MSNLTVSFLAVIHLVKPTSLPAALINVLLYTQEIDALTDVPTQNLFVYREDSEPGEGKDHAGPNKGD